MTSRRLVLLLGLTMVSSSSALAQQAAIEGREAVPEIGTLLALPAVSPEALGAFWLEVRSLGTPLVTPADVAGHSIVTFLFRGDSAIEHVRLQSNLNALLLDGMADEFDTLGALTHVEGTDVWYRSFRLRNDLRVPYEFEVTREDSIYSTADPLNPSVWEPEQGSLRASILELEGAPPQPWREYSESDRGDWDDWEFEEGPDAGRRVFIYKPESWSAEEAEPFPVLVGLGAFGHGIGMRVDRMVDHLIETGQIPPIVVVLADLEPGADSTAYESTTEFVADRLLPWMAARYGTSLDPGDVVVSGTSRRGVVAALIAHRRPQAVGNVIALSGSFYWRPSGVGEYEWVTREYAENQVRPITLYVTAGELETVISRGNAGHYMIGTNRHLRDVLTAAGYRFFYWEFNGVHSELNWQSGLADGLARLMRPSR